MDVLYVYFYGILSLNLMYDIFSIPLINYLLFVFNKFVRLQVLPQLMNMLIICFQNCICYYKVKTQLIFN